MQLFSALMQHLAAHLQIPSVKMSSTFCIQSPGQRKRHQRPNLPRPRETIDFEYCDLPLKIICTLTQQVTI